MGPRPGHRGIKLHLKHLHLVHDLLLLDMVDGVGLHDWDDLLDHRDLGPQCGSLCRPRWGEGHMWKCLSERGWKARGWWWEKGWLGGKKAI